MERANKTSRDCKDTVCNEKGVCETYRRDPHPKKRRKPFICPNIACGSSQAYNPFTSAQMQKTFNIPFPVPMGTPVSDVMRAYNYKPMVRRDYNHILGIGARLLSSLHFLLDLKVLNGFDDLAKAVKVVIIEFIDYFEHREMKPPKHDTNADKSPEIFWKIFFKVQKDREEILNSNMPELMTSPHPTGCDDLFQENQKMHDLFITFARQKPINIKVLTNFQVYRLTVTELRHIVYNLQSLSELLYSRICNEPAIESVMRIHSWTCQALRSKSDEQNMAAIKFYSMIEELINYLEASQ